jgi:hypothetical protein
LLVAFVRHHPGAVGGHSGNSGDDHAREVVSREVRDRVAVSGRSDYDGFMP